MKSIVYFLLAFVWFGVIAAFASAAAQPSRVNRAISGTVQNGMVSRGFAANDPRYGNTLARMTPYLASAAGTAGTIVVGSVTAPAWVTVAIAVGVGAVITYAVNLGLNALTNWLFRDDGLIDESGEAGPLSSSAMIAGGAYWKGSILCPGTPSYVCYSYGGDGEGIARQLDGQYRSVNNKPPAQNLTCSSSSTTVVCGYGLAMFYATGAPASCPGGSFYNGTSCLNYNYLTPPAVPTKTGVTPQVAVNDIAEADKEKQLNPALVAAIANRAWKNAASQPGYDGVPYPETNPLTAAEAQAWMSQNPNYSPTVGDFAAPNPTTSGQPSSFSLPTNPTSTTTTTANTPNTGTINPAADSPLVNLGADPVTPAPTLEEAPTAQQVLDPILNLLPDLRSYHASVSSGTCPRPTLSLFGETQTMQAHCVILDNHRTEINAAMVLAFALLALFIILSA